MVEIADKEKLYDIYSRYSGLVYRLALLRCGSRADADDVFQEVFLRLVRKMPTFDNEEHIKAWLIRVTINCSHKLLQSAWFRKTEPISELLEQSDTAADEDAAVLNAVLALPQKYRTVIYLFYYEGYSGAEIAKMLGLSESAVRTRMQRARDKLRIILDDEAQGGEL